MKDDSIIQKFLDSCNLPTLTQEGKNFLNADLSILDIQDAITSLKSGKAAGPDGYPGEFYKEFSDLLSPYLLKMYIHANLDNTLPLSMREATIIVIPKKGKDPEEVGSYRLISPLTYDQKILAKSLARRLSSLISKLIHPDQTGFIPNRHSFFNLRRLFNVIYSQRERTSDLADLSLDAEKAFDQLEWPYLFAIPRRFDLGEQFENSLKILYHRPCARIVTSKTLSPTFQLHRGTRQGCSLSPMLFASSHLLNQFIPTLLYTDTVLKIQLVKFRYMRMISCFS